MSKIGVISDIHGNYFALKEVIDLLGKKGCERIICLGDICGYYPLVNQCIDALRQINAICIKGNHDSYLLGERECCRSKTVAKCIRYQRDVITDENLGWIASLGDFLELQDIFGAHGGLCDFIDEYVDSFDFRMARTLYPDFKFFFTGHTHIQQLQTDEGLLYCNPGSVGQPRDHDPRAAFAILEDGQIALCRIDYPIEKTAEAMREAGFSDYYYRNLFEGKRIGE